MTKDELNDLQLPFDGSALELGGHFAVLLFDDYVVKIPRSKQKQEQMERIAEAHNTLSSELEGVLPCVVKEGRFLVMPKAVGTRVSDLPHGKKVEMERRISDMKKRAEVRGYVLRDIKLRDSFYDEDNDRLTIVDLSSVDSLRTGNRRARKAKR